MSKTIAVFGSGSIGTYVGGSLIAGGANVVLIGRPKVRAAIAEHGIRLTDHWKRDIRVPPEKINFSENASAMSDADLILITVKSAATEDASLEILKYARQDTLIISLQNGIGNADVMRKILPGRTILGGVVPFNVVQIGDRFHRGTFGELTVESSERLESWNKIFKDANLPLIQEKAFVGYQWGKLLLNLNNSVNALSNTPLKEELSLRSYRLVLAGLMRETLTILMIAGIKPGKVSTVPPQWLPLILSLPDSIFKLVARGMLKIDPEARSSMWDDLQAGRKTEIDFINGAVVDLAKKHGLEAPLNNKIIQLVKIAENGGKRSYTAASLYDECFVKK